MKNLSYNLRVNDKFDYTLDQDILNDMDMVSLDESTFHLLKDGKSYIAHIEDIDTARKIVTLTVNQEQFAVSIADVYDQLVNKMGLNLNVIHQVNEIKAPMPGLVLNIEISEGQEVVQGDPLLVLEAMKMENVIKSPGEGKIKTIFARKGKPVEKGEILIEME